MAPRALAPAGCLSSGVCYTPQGAEYSSAIGLTSGFAGVNFSETYNSRLQPLEIKASSAVGNAIDITYSFLDPVTSKNAGHVYGITNNLNSSRTQSFTYDQVNRIVTAGTTATSGTYCWGYQYTYDGAWGNLTSQAGWSPNYNGCSEATMGSVSADGNNHISAFSYDFRGNTTNDGTITYTYDAESQIKTAAGVTYSYDGRGSGFVLTNPELRMGRRVSKSNGKLYWYGSGGEILAETDASGNTLNEYIFFGGKRIAILPSGGSAEYYVEDLLGSSRLMTTNNGTVCYDADFDPYGGEHAYTNTCSQNYKFEGKERDTETGNDDFGARYYTSRFGRWLSADWSSVPVAVPYANLTNPQTLNLYSMVADDPESFADLDGHVSNASMGLSQPGDSGGPSCAAMGEGASSGPATAGCGNNASATQAEDQQQADAAKQQAKGAANGSAIAGLFESNPPPPAAPTPPKPPTEASQRTEYATPDAAATAAINRVNPQSINEDREYAGRGYKNADGTYSTTAPVPGTQGTSTPPPISSLPPGSQNAFRYHTHGGADPGYDNEHFSPQDRRNARNEHVSSYLGTPAGRIKKYDPSKPISNRITLLQPPGTQQ